MRYAVISINDSRIINVNNIKNNMIGWELVDSIKYVDGKIEDGFKILKDLGISTSVYKPDDGRKYPMTKEEAGCWASHINCIIKTIENKYPILLVFEDDAIISDDFLEKFNLLIQDLPKDFDFLSLFNEPSQNVFDEKSDIGSKYIHKSLSQLSMNVCMLYSLKGAYKIMKIAKHSGATYNIDSVIYRASCAGFLNGYIIRPDIKQIVHHGVYESIIDKNNRRITKI